MGVIAGTASAAIGRPRCYPPGLLVAAPARRRLRRWVLALTALLVLLLCTTVVVLRVGFHGEALAERLTAALNERMRGHLEVRSIEWELRDLRKVVTGGWVPVTIHDVELKDDSGDVVFRTARLTTELDIHAIMFGRHDVVLRNIHVDGGWVKLKQTTEPYPMHAYDRTIVSIISAFYPRDRPTFAAGIYAAAPPPIFDLRDAHIRDVDLEIWSAPSEQDTHFASVIALDGVDADGFMYMDPTDPLVPRMYFSLTPTAATGQLRIDNDVKTGRARYTIELRDVVIGRLAQLPTGWPATTVASSLELDITAHMTPRDGAPAAEQATLHLFGDLRNYWARPYDGTWDLRAEVANLGPTLNAAINPALRGANVSGAFGVSGPYIAPPKITWERVTGLEYDLALSAEEAPLRLRLGALNGDIDLVNDRGNLSKSVAEIYEGDGVGRIQLDGTFELAPYRPHLTIAIIDPIDLGRFVDRWMPPSIGRSLGHHLTGGFVVDGDPELALGLEQLELGLSASRDAARPITRVSGGRIVAEDTLTRLTLARDRSGTPMTVQTGGTRLEFLGSANTRHETIDMTIDAQSSDLATWLRRFELPRLATAADRARITVRGDIASPVIAIDTRLRGVKAVGDLELVAQLSGNQVELQSVSTAGLGGQVRGRGQIRLGGTSGRDPYLERFELVGEGLSAERVAAATGNGPPVRGTIDHVDLRASGSLGGAMDLEQLLAMADGELRTREIEVGGEVFHDVGVCINRPEARACQRAEAPPTDDNLAACRGALGRDGACLTATATRNGGGTIDAVLARDAARRGGGLAGTVALADIPSQAIAALLGRQLALGGDISTELRVGGTIDAPRASGAVALVRGWIGQTFVGDVDVAVVDDPTTPGAVRLAGSAMGGQLAVDATVGLTAPYPIDVALRGRRIEVDPIVDLQALVGAPFPIRAWATGRITLHAEAGSKAAPIVWVELEELTAIADYIDGDGRPLPLRLAAVATDPNRPAVSMRATPAGVELACRRRDNAGALVAPGPGDSAGPCSLTLATPAGAVAVTGAGTRDALAFTADGVLDLALVQPLFGEMFDDVRGTADLHAELSGAATDPTYAASLDLHDVGIRPAGQETIVQLPGGFIKVDNHSLGFSDVRVRVDDTYLNKQSELTLRGLVAHDHGVAKDWSIIIDGEFAGKMLLAAMPSAFSQATGVAVIEDAITISGHGATPDIEGSLRFDPAQPLAVVPRGLRRELAFQGGTIDIETTQDDDAPEDVRTYGVTLDGVRGAIDGEGRLTDISGFVAVRDGNVTSADIAIEASGISFRIPRTLDLVLNATDMHVLRADARAPLEIAGKIEVVSGTFTKNLELSTFLQPTAPSTDARPIWDDVPALGGAVLDLGVQVSSLGVRSNFGELDLSSEDLKITGTPRDPRVEGQIDVGQGRLHIPGTRATFTRTSGRAEFAPQTRLLDGTPRLAITAEADYRDPSGQDNLITLTLKGDYPRLSWDLTTSTGLTKAQTVTLILLGRTPEQLRASLGDDAIGSDPTRIDTSTTDTTLTDQLLKDIAGDWISSQIGDQLLKVIPLDVMRFYVTTGGIGFHGEKRLVENINLVGDAEQTVAGRTFNVRGELKTPSRLSFQVGYLSKVFTDEAEEDVSDLQIKAVFRWLLF